MATYYVASYGSNTNNGTSPSTPWQSLTFALGAASGTNPGMTAGDTLWIAPGVYRETAGVTYNGNNGTSGNTVNIYGDPTFSRTWTSGAVGPVRLTTASSDNAFCTAGTSALVINKEYVTIQDICFDANPPNSLGLGATGVLGIGSVASNITVSRCVFQTDQANSANRFFCIGPNIGNGKSNFTFEKCVFLNGGAMYCGINTQSTTPHNVNVIIRDCIHIGTEGYTFFGQTAGQANGISIYNCTSICSSNCFYCETLATNSGTTIRNCSFTGLRSATVLYSTSTSMLSEDYNRLSGATIRTNVTAGTNTINAQTVLDKDSGLIQGYGTFPFISAIQGFASIGSGVVSGAPTSDIYGVTWLGNPSMGAAESKARGAGAYLPTERNASTITIAPGSTSQSIELYLGATGLTASTSGLSAYYNRTRSADVQIPLVARTIGQAWTSGGFAEVNPNTMPGLYRLDIPNEALAAGADDVTVVVRGASGTNGAVMTIKLSSGGLTTAQTASAVWGALTNDHTTHGTFGWNVLRADQDSKEGLVTLHQSGGISRVDADVHAIANDTAAATALKGALNHDGTGYVDSDVVRISTSTAAANELEGALLHNGTDYIDSNLLSGNSTQVFVGRFQLTQTGTTQGDIIEAFTTDTPSFELQLFDGDNNIVPVTGATLGLRILDVTSTVVETGTPTIEYGTGGIVRWTAPGSYVSIGCPAGMYRLFVDRTVSGTTTTFGPLQIKVQVQ